MTRGMGARGEGWGVSGDTGAPINGAPQGWMIGWSKWSLLTVTWESRCEKRERGCLTHQRTTCSWYLSNHVNQDQMSLILVWWNVLYSSFMIGSKISQHVPFSSMLLDKDSISYILYHSTIWVYICEGIERHQKRSEVQPVYVWFASVMPLNQGLYQHNPVVSILSDDCLPPYSTAFLELRKLEDVFQ